MKGSPSFRNNKCKEKDYTQRMKFCDEGLFGKRDEGPPAKYEIPEVW